MKNIPKAKVGFLPSREGLEIPIALSLGFKEENLYAIDKSPQMMIHAPWRAKYKKINVYGSEVARAGQRMHIQGVKLDAVNLDLCGTFSRPTIDSLAGFLRSGCMKNTSLIAYTLFKGREHPDMTELIEKHNSRPIAMARLLFDKDNNSMDLLGFDEYKTQSKSVRLTWAMLRIGHLDRGINIDPLYPKRTTDKRVKTKPKTTSFRSKILKLVEEEVLSRIETATETIRYEVINELTECMEPKLKKKAVAKKRGKATKPPKYNGVQYTWKDLSAKFNMKTSTLTNMVNKQKLTLTKIKNKQMEVRLSHAL